MHISIMSAEMKTQLFITERKVLTFNTSTFIFTSKIWGEGQLKWLLSLELSAHLNGRTNCAAVHSKNVCSGKRSRQGGIVGGFGSGPSSNNVNREDQSRTQWVIKGVNSVLSLKMNAQMLKRIPLVELSPIQGEKNNNIKDQKTERQ